MTTMITMFADDGTEFTTRANVIFKDSPQKIALHIKMRTPTPHGCWSERQEITLHATVAQYQALLSSLTTSFFDLLNELPAEDLETTNG